MLVRRTSLTVTWAQVMGFETQGLPLAYGILNDNMGRESTT